MIIETEQHSIEKLMDNAFVKMRGLISADTVVGTPFTTANSVTIIPISKVTMGFITGGGEYSGASNDATNPYAGGSGTGASIVPIAFIVNNGSEVKLINIDGKTPLDSILSMLPGLVDKIFGNEKKCKK